MKREKSYLFIAFLCLIFLLTGCRTRTNGTGEADKASGRIASGAPDPAVQGETVSGEARDASGRDSGESNAAEDGEPGSRSRENEEASRKEYDENAPAEIVPGTDRLLHSEGEGNGAPVNNEEEEKQVSRLDDQAEKPAVQTVAAGEAEQTGISEDAEVADSAFRYYTVLLQERAGSLFECQRANVFWEASQDYLTVYKTSPEHALILGAGAYDVSARLLQENLQVDDGWVARKNPGVIVKIVDSTVLGNGVYSVSPAKAVLRRIIARDGWAAVDAVRNNRVLLLSEEVLTAPYLQLAAMVLIAGTADPALYEDVNPDEMLQMLMEEATGTLPAGIYYYCMEE